MTLDVVAAIPVKPFGLAKGRLAAVLTPGERRHLGERLARHTVEVAAAAGALPLVLSADDEVTDWARSADIDVLLDEGSSLDEAATAARDWALGEGRGWLIVHADLPLLTTGDLVSAVRQVAAGGSVIAASSDGGTSLVGSTSSLRFAYGPGSFHRHLRLLAATEPLILATTGLALDLDTPADLEAVRAHPRSRWLDLGDSALAQQPGNH